MCGRLPGSSTSVASPTCSPDGASAGEWRIPRPHRWCFPRSNKPSSLAAVTIPRSPHLRLVADSAAGSQNTSLSFSEALVDAGVIASIDTVGDALGSALMESTIGLAKTELIDFTARSWTGVAKVERDSSECVHWYSTVRLHTSIGFLPPIEHGANYRMSTGTPRREVA